MGEEMREILITLSDDDINIARDVAIKRNGSQRMAKRGDGEALKRSW